MGLSEFDENIVHYYNNYLLNYLDSTVNINGSHKNNIIIQGFQTLLHVLSILYTINMSEEQINSYLEKCPLLFVEYTEQVYLKKTDILHTPSMFVYNVLLGNIQINDHKCKQNSFMKNLIKWSHIILFWENKNLTVDNRKYFVKNFLKPYLLLFTQDSLSLLSSIFENIQNSVSYKISSYEYYSFLLTSFFNFFSEKKIITYNQETIKAICFEKFMRDKDTFDNLVEDVSSLKDMDGLIKWIFSN
jgi:hypothetical protein